MRARTLPVSLIKIRSSYYLKKKYNIFIRRYLRKYII